ncbi:hypothetical protein RhiirA4_480833 [Rhizophagus irregularis]|uniref:Uncharacterized protein n=1 Tax=Rhizophagus irregularis TaxID=588596 RepID=A0A2I1HIK6_9GLOM|nr:hypothetical protein RhiirA4_480833 [Rhizophagus irregularis]
MRRLKTNCPCAIVPKLRVKAKKLQYEGSFINDTKNVIPFKDIQDNDIENSAISPDNPADEESGSTGKNSPEKANEVTTSAYEDPKHPKYQIVKFGMEK